MKRAFTLVELVIVIVLMGFVTFMVIKLPALYSPPLTADKLRDYLHPNGTFYMFEDGSTLAVFPDKNISGVNIRLNLPEVYEYKKGTFEKKDFGYLNDKKIVFKYSEKNGIGDFFILKSEEGVYVFKPLFIFTARDFDSAKELFLSRKFSYTKDEVW